MNLGAFETPPPHSLPPPRPPDPAESIRRSISVAKAETDALCRNFRTNLAASLADLEAFRAELRNELQQLRSIFNARPLPQLDDASPTIHEPRTQSSLVTTPPSQPRGTLVTLPLTLSAAAADRLDASMVRFGSLPPPVSPFLGAQLDSAPSTQATNTATASVPVDKPSKLELQGPSPSDLASSGGMNRPDPEPLLAINTSEPIVMDVVNMSSLDLWNRSSGSGQGESSRGRGKFDGSVQVSKPPFSNVSSLEMGGRKHKGVDHNNKLKAVSSVWRPVSRLSTQASSDQECLVTDKLEEEVNPFLSTQISSAQDDIEVASAVPEATKFTACSSVSQDNEEDKVLGGESVVLTEKHSISVEVGASLHRFVRGKGGSTQKMIEDETGVKIKIPLSKKEDSIIIEGLSSESLIRASEKIQAIIDEAVKSPSLDYSHFISLPLAIHPDLVDKLVNFQNSILGITDSSRGGNLDSGSNEDDSDNEDEDQKLEKGSDVPIEVKADVKMNMTNIPLVSYAPKSSKSSTLSDLGIEKSIFIKPETFHLTVLMLKLWNKDRVHAATEVLQRISSEVMEALDNRPLSIRLKGLNCMRGSFAKAGVLYAPVEEIGSEGRLLRACQVIIDAFVKAGLVLEKDANQSLKLHATVMNARHRKRSNQKRKYSTFDARGIYKQYGSEEWGEYLIREAHLSQRFVFDDKGYYHCCASIPFPEMCI